MECHSLIHNQLLYAIVVVQLNESQHLEQLGDQRVHLNDLVDHSLCRAVLHQRGQLSQRVVAAELLRITLLAIAVDEAVRSS